MFPTQDTFLNHHHHHTITINKGKIIHDMKEQDIINKPLPSSEQVSYVLYYTYLGCPMHQESISLHELEQEILLMSNDTGYSYLEVHEKRVKTTLKRIAIYPTASQRPAEGTDTKCLLDAKTRSEFCYKQEEIPF